MLCSRRRLPFARYDSLLLPDAENAGAGDEVVQGLMATCEQHAHQTASRDGSSEREQR